MKLELLKREQEKKILLSPSPPASAEVYGRSY